MSDLSADAGYSRAVISIRVVDIDYYLMPLDKYSPVLAFQAARLSLLGALELPKLPTIRIFGCTPAGQKACVHLHGARPFLYVMLPEDIPSTNANSFSEKLKGALEAALASSYAHDPETGGTAHAANGSSFPAPFIDTIEPLLRTSVYGYHDSPSVFLKISVYNPRNVQRIANILYSGLCAPEHSLEIRMQPFEAHIPFILQVMTDLSLVGMGYINLSACKFRLPMRSNGSGVPSKSAIDPLSVSVSQRRFSSQTQHQRPELFWSFPGARRAVSELELDAFVGDVLNPLEVSEPKILGQRPGPNRYSAKTLRILWLEERIRTGTMPQLPREGERSVRAGPNLSDPHLVSKLRDIVHRSLAVQGRSRAQIPESPPSEVREFQDVIHYLDCSSSTSKSSRALNNTKTDGSRSSGSVDDIPNDIWEDVVAWDDIASSTPDILAIPQGDGHGHGVCEKGDLDDNSEAKTPAKRKTSSRRRRRRFVGGYKLLETVADARTVKSSSSSPGFRGFNPDSQLLPSARPDDELRDDAVAGFPMSTQTVNSKIVMKAQADDTGSEQTRRGDADAVHSREPESDELVGSLSVPNVESASPLQGNATMQAPREGSVDERAHSRGHKVEAMEHYRRQIFKAKTGRLEEDALFFQPICPKIGAPLRSTVVAEFGVGKLVSGIHEEPYCGDASDGKTVDTKVGGTPGHIRPAGVNGLLPAEPDFTRAKLPCISCLWTSVVPVREPPLVSVVTFSTAGISDDRALKGLGGHRTHIDSAGREVVMPWGHVLETQSNTPITPPKCMSGAGAAQTIRRRVESCVPNNSDSESSCGSEVDDISSLVRGGVGGKVPDSSAQVAKRPLSPKYDDSSFFPETPYRFRKSVSASLDADSPIHPLGSLGDVSDAFDKRITSNSEGQGQSLTIATLEVSRQIAFRRIMYWLRFIHDA
jgi:hypothetical protein